MDGQTNFIRMAVILLSAGVITSSCAKREAITANVKKGREHYKMAVSLVRQKRGVGKAIQHIHAAIRYGYDEGKVFGTLGGLYYILGKKKEARKFLRIALEKLTEERTVYARKDEYMKTRVINKLIVDIKKKLAKLDEPEQIEG